jgi:hypothetical protein
MIIYAASSAAPPFESEYSRLVSRSSGIKALIQFIQTLYRHPVD